MAKKRDPLAGTSLGLALRCLSGDQDAQREQLRQANNYKRGCPHATFSIVNGLRKCDDCGQYLDELEGK